MQLLALLALFVAAFLEITGDVSIGRGMQNRSLLPILGGAALLIVYGVAVNLYNVVIAKRGQASWDFTRMLGVYIACFAVMNLLLALAHRKPLTRSTVVGTVVIAVGGAIVQWGRF
jgi:hypothetical protein